MDVTPRRVCNEVFDHDFVESFDPVTAFEGLVVRVFNMFCLPSNVLLTLHTYRCLETSSTFLRVAGKWLYILETSLSFRFGSA